MRPQRAERRVVLAEVRPRGPGGDADVHAVVHEHRNGQRADEAAGQREQGARRGVLEPDLDRGRAAAHRPAARVHGVAPLEETRIRDHHQAQLIDESHE